MRGICVNHDCERFEFPVPVSNDLEDAETERCSSCNQLLCHESGLTFRDALAAGAEPRPSQTCDRCRRPAWGLSGSYFDMAMICAGCHKAEQAHPDYERAKAVENDEVRRGNLNFPGIGLPADLAGGGWSP